MSTLCGLTNVHCVEEHDFLKCTVQVNVHKVYATRYFVYCERFLGILHYSVYKVYNPVFAMQCVIPFHISSTYFLLPGEYRWGNCLNELGFRIPIPFRVKTLNTITICQHRITSIVVSSHIAYKFLTGRRLYFIYKNIFCSRTLFRLADLSLYRCVGFNRFLVRICNLSFGSEPTKEIHTHGHVI